MLFLHVGFWVLLSEILCSDSSYDIASLYSCCSSFVLLCFRIFSKCLLAIGPWRDISINRKCLRHNLFHWTSFGNYIMKRIISNHQEILLLDAREASISLFHLICRADPT
jgi:hypothetical protein